MLQRRVHHCGVGEDRGEGGSVLLSAWPGLRQWCSSWHGGAARRGGLGALQRHGGSARHHWRMQRGDRVVWQLVVALLWAAAMGRAVAMASQGSMGGGSE